MYVLTEHTLQKWSVTPHDIEKLIFECEVGRRIREAFQEKVWDPQGGNPDEQESWLLDMQPTSDGVAILAASVHPQISQNMQFAIGKLSFICRIFLCNVLSNYYLFHFTSYSCHGSCCTSYTTEVLYCSQK